MAIKKIGLDAGHGLKTAGKQTPTGIKEWTLNDNVRDRVVELLKDYDVEFIFTDNDEGNVDESLAQRFNKYIKDGVDVFVSIHHNAFTGQWNNATGVEVFTDRTPSAKDKELAECIYPLLVKYTGLKGRGIKQENWYVINHNHDIPSVLCEGGFMDSEIDYPVITSKAGKDGYARAIAEGLIKFLKLEKKAVATVTYYRVGTSWSNGKCVGQVGAFTNKDNAIKKAKENSKWKVFDDKGNIIYQTVTTSSTATSTSTSFVNGAKLNLSKVDLYNSSTAKTKTNTKTGIFYVWSTAAVNGRIRITNSISNVGKSGAVTGWINEVDAKKSLTSSTTTTTKSLDAWAKEVIDGKHGIGHVNREASLKKAGCTYSYESVRARVNALLK